MKIWLGSEDDINLDEKIYWLKISFSEDQYKIYEGGFLIREYYLEFTEDRYATLYRIHWS